MQKEKKKKDWAGRCGGFYNRVAAGLRIHERNNICRQVASLKKQPGFRASCTSFIQSKFVGITRDLQVHRPQFHQTKVYTQNFFLNK